MSGKERVRAARIDAFGLLISQEIIANLAGKKEKKEVKLPAQGVQSSTPTTTKNER
ncbi:MAG: hypothetical protein GW762_05985 [Candidatus Pacebacteria bacterium]|nr:hypothetical protein [Candidatus Paceibacterota bacterium]